ncbi:MAG: hypothetical protein DCC67_00950 [Planctomycetota bacterium]|nr:MAG: hypothetical protein DCC67_00950 [Planctomycetota bacterium]
MLSSRLQRAPCGRWQRVLLIVLLGRPAAHGADPAARVEFQPGDGQVAVTIGGEPFATYVYRDAAITRPYFAHLRAPGGMQATRNHPPVAGVDSPDHATFHPGLWLSFGDISGYDYWRLAAPVQFERFVAEPAGGAGRGSFAARLAYLKKPGGEPLCFEDFRCEIRAMPAGRLILWDSTFTSDAPFVFGDQEEMGLGFRVATPIRAERGSESGLPPGNGEIVNSRGDRNEQQIWGRAAEWADYRGELAGRQVGIAVFPHPENFRRCWFHARDYGMLAANPFGRQSFGQGEKSAVTVQPGEAFRLRYGVLVHSTAIGEQLDLAAAYADYTRLASP